MLIISAIFKRTFLTALPSTVSRKGTLPRQIDRATCGKGEQLCIKLIRFPYLSNILSNRPKELEPIMARSKFELETPCLILDIDVLETNIVKMQSLATHNGKSLRPHAKTHKCTTIAKKQIEAGAIGVCAAKVSEAERLTKTGIKGILITGPFAGKQQVRKILEILSESPSLMTSVDNLQTVDDLDAALRSAGLEMDVLLDIDVGLKRTGAKPSEALTFAEKILERKNLRLRGIQAYAGHLQHVPLYNDRKKASQASLGEVIPVFNKLKSQVENLTIFSASGTGTFEIDGQIPEVTEHQVGSYVVMDAEYYAIESSNNSQHFIAFEPALRLLTTAVSVNQHGFVTVDAGLKSIYKDGANPFIISPGFRGMKYDWFGDEYGKIIYSEDDKPPELGTVLEIVTSHCDPTINLFDKFYVTKGDEVVDEWPIDLRGCSQ